MQGRVYALPDVWIRPAFGGKGRKVTGTLEAHANGFRYTSPKGEELDVLYRSVCSGVFQGPFKHTARKRKTRWYKFCACAATGTLSTPFTSRLRRK